MVIKGTERNGKQWNQKSYKQITCLGISFISKWLLTEQNGSELNGTERKATCFYPYLPTLSIASFGLPSPSRSVIPVCHWLSFISKWLLKERNGTESNGTKRLGYKQITCLGISFISKWNRTDLN